MVFVLLAIIGGVGGYFYYTHRVSDRRSAMAAKLTVSAIQYVDNLYGNDPQGVTWVALRNSGLFGPGYREASGGGLESPWGGVISAKVAEGYGWWLTWRHVPPDVCRRLAGMDDPLVRELVVGQQEFGHPQLPLSSSILESVCASGQRQDLAFRVYDQ